MRCRRRLDWSQALAVDLAYIISILPAAHLTSIPPLSTLVLSPTCLSLPQLSLSLLYSYRASLLHQPQRLHMPSTSSSATVWLLSTPPVLLWVAYSPVIIIIQSFLTPPQPNTVSVHLGPRKLRYEVLHSSQVALTFDDGPYIYETGVYLIIRKY